MSDFKPKTILYIPDVHVKAGDKLERFYDLKRWLADRRIKLDHVIQGGDLWDCEAFCTHEMMTPEFFDKHFWNEFEQGFKALDIMESFARLYGNRGCKFSMTEGNHENRIAKFMSSDNRLRTSPFPKTAGELVRYYRPRSKLNYVPFLQPLVVEGIVFSHYFVSGLMGRAQGGERPAANILRTQFQSTVSCHSHVLDFAERTRADGSKIFSLVGGCFVNHDDPFKFSGAARKLWWEGVTLIHVTGPGEYDIETVSSARLSN